MKKLKLTRIIASLLIAVSLLALSPIGASAEWKQDNNGWWYAESDSYVTGWRTIDGKWYFFNSDGYMVHDKVIDGYQLGSDGSWVQETVIATIGDDKITSKDLAKAMKSDDFRLKQQYGNDYATNSGIKEEISQIKKEALIDLVAKKIILKKASQLSLIPSDDELNKQINYNINRYNDEHPELDFASAVQKRGMTLEEAKQSLKDTIIINVVQKSIGKDISVTDEEVNAYYNKYKDTKFTVAAGANAAHILVADEATAKSLKAKLDSGADFVTLAKENSLDTGSKNNGGDLGFISYNSDKYIPEFMDGFKSLKEGEVSEPVKSKFGYHLIKATGIKGAEVISFDQVKEDIRASLLNDKQGSAFSEKVEEWKNELNVKIYDDRV